MNAVRGADALLDALPPATLVVGKGGVGKTTTACALAWRSAERGLATLLVTTDPARAMPDVLGSAIGTNAAPIPEMPNLRARVLDASVLRSAFLERWGSVLRQILDRGTYLDDSDIGPLVDTALPGGDEIFAALELARLLRPEGADAPQRMFIDTAPTGHTLRLLELPGTFRALVQLLDAMQEKHRYMVRTLTRTYRADDADRFLTEMAELVRALDDALRDRARCGALLVANEQPLVVEESRRYVAALTNLRIAVAGVVWNGVSPMRPLPDVAGNTPGFTVPRLESWPTGAAGLRAWARALEPLGNGRSDIGNGRLEGDQREPVDFRFPISDFRSVPHFRFPIADFRSVLRPLTIVAGKGGVGKTSVASALALLAPGEARVLVVSTDPAPSLADAFAQAIPDADTPVAGAEGLFARQMDATAAFARVREEYATRVDALFDSIMGSGLDLAADRAVARDLLALAPPGVDEIYALSLVSDALFDERYGTVIVDPAPTGHLLRMLEMPELALAWTHQLMRLLLKYKDVTGLGETARELLEFSRRLRTLNGLLSDADRAGVVLVGLDEPVVQSETRRLADAIRARGVAITGVVLNRAQAGSGALPVPDAPVHFEAPVAAAPPAGVDALRRWAATWRIVTPNRATST